jgi:hypothetical protein
MKKGLTILFQVAVVLIGLCVLAFMLWEPHLEGRNIHATFVDIYFKDPFLAYAYIGSIPFFVIIYQSFTLLGYIGQNNTLSPNSMRALRTIKYCALSLIGLIVLPVSYLFIVRPGDDIAGGVAMGVFMIIISITIATTARVFEKIFQKKQSLKP